MSTAIANYLYYNTQIVIMVPAAPTGVSATLSGNTATVSFTPSVGATSYTVTSNTGGYTGTSTSSPITVSGLAVGIYTFTVTATSVVGTSAASAASGSMTVSAPDAPTGVSVTLSGSTATVSFTSSVGATSYTATSSPGGYTGTSTASPITVSGLASGTYTFTVTATSVVGTSVASAASGSVTVTAPDAPNGVVFIPAYVSSVLTLWLDASDTSTITSSSGNVTQWNDKSGLGYHFIQATTANSPTTGNTTLNSRNMVNFTSSKYMTNTTCPMGTNYTIFAVGYTSSNGWGRLLHGSATDDAFIYLGTGNGVTQYATFTGNGVGWNDTTTNSPATSVTSACIMELTNNGTSTGLIPYVNGTAQTAKNGTNAGFTGFVMGNYKYSGGVSLGAQWWNGYVAEVLVYNSVLSTTDRQTVEGYLASKWGLQSSLPVGHTYKSTSPPSGVFAMVSGNVAIVSFTSSASATSYTATSSPGGITGTLTSSASGPLSITVYGLTIGTSYTFTVTATGPGGTSAASAASNSVTAVMNLIIGTVTYSGTGGYPGTSNVNGIAGTAITNGVTYNVYTFMNSTTSTSYTITYTCVSQTTIYVLAVGGGGQGSSGGGGGGGGGGVVMIPVTLPAGVNQTITVSVGAGAPGIAGNTYASVYGSNTTVNFSAIPSANIIAGGGGLSGGGSNNAPNSTSYGSAGGSAYYLNPATSANIATGYNNYANVGGCCNFNTVSGGGGGAGTAGAKSPNSTDALGAGDGIQCFLPGIADFAPSGTSYKTYYWGGGGGGGGNITIGKKGGLGGGGGGATAPAAATGGIGGAGLNAGGNGANSNGASGAGGANTGGGAGGAWNGSVSAGGSGIVIIAFPQTVVTTSTMSTLTNTSLSVAAYRNINGAYACKLLNYNYYGPIFTLRYSTDTNGIYTKNFYADASGANIGDGYLGTGTSLSSWLSTNSANATYAYMTKWYNQGTDACFNCATQYTLASQPVYEVVNQVVNFGYQGIAPQTNCLLGFPDNTFPYGTKPPYTFITKFGVLNTTGGGIWQNGATGTGNNTSILIYTGKGGTTGYINDFWDGGSLGKFGSGVADNQTVSVTYNGSAATHYGIINGTKTLLSNGDTLTIPGTNQFLGYSPGSTSSYFNSQLYTFYVCKMSLIDTDRLFLESGSANASPTGLPAAPTNVTLAISGTTGTIAFTASAGATSYTAYSTPGGLTASATSSPITLTGLTNGAYTFNVVAFNANGPSPASNQATLTAPSITLNNYSNVYTNGSYKIYAYKTTGSTNTISVTGASAFNPAKLQIFAIGGGGSGGAEQAGGGGGGGVVQSIITLTSNDTISVTVGDGGPSSSRGVTGGNTTIGFTTNTSYNITAYGGGGGSAYGTGPNLDVNGTAIATSNVGSGGGGGSSGPTVGGQTTSTYTLSGTTYPQGYAGGTYSSRANGGGGGAGGTGFPGIDVTDSGAGGTGIQINTSILNYFSGGSIDSKAISNLWWAGGGGGGLARTGTSAGSGGKGGGGGGSIVGGTPGTGDTNGLNNGSNGITGNTIAGGVGGTNTGGGSGGGSQGGGGIGAKGGSGIVLIAVLA